MSILQMPLEFGLVFWAVLLACVLSHPIALGAVIAMRSRKRRLAMGLSATALVMSISVLVAGVLAYLWSLDQVERFLEYSSIGGPRGELREIGQNAALTNLCCGLAGAALPAISSLFALRRSLIVPTEELLGGDDPRP